MQDIRSGSPALESDWQYFSSATIPVRERLRAIREMAAAGPIPCEVMPCGPAQRSVGYALALPGLTVMGGVARDTAYRHTPRQSNDGGSFMLMFVLGGRFRVRQGHRDFVVNRGDALVSLSGEPFRSATVPGCDCRTLALVMPAGVFRESAVRPRDLLRGPLRCDGPAMRLLRLYLQGVSRIAPAPGLPRLVAAHVHDLVLLALGASVGTAPSAGARGASADRLFRLKQDIRGRVDAGQPVHLVPLAVRHRVSTRYVQKLFEKEGVDLSTFVCNERLERAYHRLASPRFARCKISTVALDCGFENLAWFNRAFKRRYGIPPSRVRVR